MKKTLLMLVFIASCADEGPMEQEPPTPEQACHDLVSAMASMFVRCGWDLPGTGANSGLMFVDCSTVTGITDMDALYEVCLPALADVCESVPSNSLQCNQLQF